MSCIYLSSLFSLLQSTITSGSFLDVPSKGTFWRLQDSYMEEQIFIWVILMYPHDWTQVGICVGNVTEQREVLFSLHLAGGAQFWSVHSWWCSLEKPGSHSIFTTSVLTTHFSHVMYKYFIWRYCETVTIPFLKKLSSSLFTYISKISEIPVLFIGVQCYCF